MKWSRYLTLTTRLRRWLMNYYLTNMGKTVFAAIIVSGIASILISTYQIVTILIFLFISAFVVGFIFWPRIEVSESLPDKMVANRPIKATFTIKNLSRFPAYDISLGLFQLPREFSELNDNQYIKRIAPGASETFDIEMVSTKRGVYSISNPRCFTTYPFNLFRYGRWNTTQKAIIVLPDYHPIERMDIASDLRYQTGGIVEASLVGESPEYIGNREFQPGDSTRRLDTRAWARLVKPVVKEYHEEYYCHVAIVMDTYHSRRHTIRSDAKNIFESSVRLTAAIANYLSIGERIVDFFVAGSDLYVFRTGRHTGVFENVLDILASIKESTKSPFKTITPELSEELSQTSSIIFVLQDWNQDHENLLRLAVEAGCQCRVFIIGNNKTSHDITEGEHLAGHFTFLETPFIDKGHVKIL